MSDLYMEYEFNPVGRNNIMNEEQIKHMVNRFLGWKLPEDFRPDAGISFKPTFNEHTAHPQRHEPSGTNLFDYMQAEAMVRHMLVGLPLSDRELLNTPMTNFNKR